MNGNGLETISKPKPNGTKDTQLKCTDVARALQQNFHFNKPRKSPIRYSYPGVQDHRTKKYEFINMVGANQSGDSNHSLPPLYNYNNSLVRETTWYRFKANKDREDRREKSSLQSPTPKLTYVNSLKLPDDRSPERRKKKNSNKENRVVNQKFLDYINRKRELTRQLHVDSNQVNMLERPGMSPQNSPAVLKREATNLRDKIADFRRWRDKETGLLNEDNHRRDKTEINNANNQLLRHKTTVSKAKPDDLQDVRLLRKALKEHDQRMDSRDSARRSKTSKESKDSSIQAPHPPKKERPSSSGTWHTWRDINTSYAYDDVKKYIEDNDLMSPSKDARIRRWANDVDRHMPHIMGSGELPIIGAVDERMSTDLTSSDSVRS